ncbi:hypothetical protein KCU98_g16471, partial [Aureobasidium melanogenum]
ELTEATYEFKVQYNERPLSAESYLAESLDAFKHSFKGFSDSFGRHQLRDILKHELDQQVLNLLASRYWNRPLEDLSAQEGEGFVESLSALPKADPNDQLWRLKLDASSASLTKLGIGRLATTVAAECLQAHVERLISSSTFNAHPFAQTAITQAAQGILHDLAYDTSDELEICVKPYKHRIDLEDSEWTRGRENVQKVLRAELRDCEDAVKAVEAEMGGKKRFKDVVAFIDKVRKGDINLEGNSSGGAGGFSAALLAKGREAVFLRDRADILRMRLLAIKSKACANKNNKYICPEIFLDAVADKLTTTADLFIDAELLSKFYYQFPRALDSKFRSLSPQQLDQFAREDPKIRRHLDVVHRKELLEHVLKEMEALKALEAREKRAGRGGRESASRLSERDRLGDETSDRRKRGWGLF